MRPDRRVLRSRVESMKTPKSPQDKKADSYAKDRRNTYGENDKSSRKNIPKSRALDHRRARRTATQPLMTAKGRVSEAHADDVHTAATTKWIPTFKKSPDTPLGDVVASKKGARPKGDKRKKPKAPAPSRS